MPVLQPGQVAAYAKAAGWPQDKVAWVVTVSFAESSWNTDATHYNTKDGTTDYGLMQCNSIHANSFPDFFPPSENWKNPLTNMTVAKKIFDSQGEGAWVSSDNPKRKQVAGVADQVASQIAGINDPKNLAILTGGQVSDWPNWVDWLGKTLGGGVTAPDFTKYPNSAGFPPSVGNTGIAIGTDIATNGLAGAVFGEYGPYLWIAGGSVLVLLGVLLLAKDTDIGKAALSAAKVAAL
jgi:hypothetical protein